MTQRQEIIERLNGLELEGGSHEMLSAICKAVLPHDDAWTLRRCADLRDRLVRLLGEADTPHSSDGRITDELRKWLRSLYTPNSGTLKSKGERIADRIDAAHDKAIASVMNDALYHANDKDMADLGWVRLPKDADGVPTRVGDVMVMASHPFGREDKPLVVDRMELSRGMHGEVWCLVLDTDMSCWTQAAVLRHHHAPTVEDVLREFYVFAVRGKEAHAEDVDDAVLAEYAAKLRLAGGDAE